MESQELSESICSQQAKGMQISVSLNGTGAVAVQHFSSVRFYPWSIPILDVVVTFGQVVFYLKTFRSFNIGRALDM